MGTKGSKKAKRRDDAVTSSPAVAAAVTVKSRDDAVTSSASSAIKASTAGYIQQNSNAV